MQTQTKSANANPPRSNVAVVNAAEPPAKKCALCSGAILAASQTIAGFHVHTSCLEKLAAIKCEEWRHKHAMDERRKLFNGRMKTGELTEEMIQGKALITGFTQNGR